MRSQDPTKDPTPTIPPPASGKCPNAGPRQRTLRSLHVATKEARTRAACTASRRRLWTVFGLSVVPVVAVVFVAGLIHTIPVDLLAQDVPPLTHDPLPVTPTDDDPPPGDPFFIADAQPGAPRPWESGIRVAPYSTVNVLNRNVFTVVPIISWSGVGPAMSMNFYHNSANVDADYDVTRGMDFGLGAGWTTSYRSDIIDGFKGKRAVIADDSTGRKGLRENYRKAWRCRKSSFLSGGIIISIVHRDGSVAAWPRRFFIGLGAGFESAFPITTSL